MNETISMGVAFVAGIALGVIFFGGLWFTVKKAVSAKIPALWIFGSFILRMSITLLGFYVVGLDQWQNLMLCLLGFIIARFTVIHSTKSIDAKQAQLKKEEIHGS